MPKYIMPIGKEEIKKALINIGQEIIDRAEDVANDIKQVRSITIFSEIEPSQVPTVKIEKEYLVTEKEPKQIAVGDDKLLDDFTTTIKNNIV